MITVHKYNIGGLKTKMPVGAQVLSAGMQNGVLVGWAKVDTDMPLEEVSFSVYGTGHLMPPDGVFITTIFDGELVWHVFKD